MKNKKIGLVMLLATASISLYAGMGREKQQEQAPQNASNDAPKGPSLAQRAYAALPNVTGRLANFQENLGEQMGKVNVNAAPEDTMPLFSNLDEETPVQISSTPTSYYGHAKEAVNNLANAVYHTPGAFVKTMGGQGNFMSDTRQSIRTAANYANGKDANGNQLLNANTGKPIQVSNKSFYNLPVRALNRTLNAASATGTKIISGANLAARGVATGAGVVSSGAMYAGKGLVNAPGRVVNYIAPSVDSAFITGNGDSGSSLRTAVFGKKTAAASDASTAINSDPNLTDIYAGDTEV